MGHKSDDLEERRVDVMPSEETRVVFGVMWRQKDGLMKAY